MKESLQEICDYLRRVLPAKPPISNLQIVAESQLITFQWQSKEFVVRSSLRTFEKKGKQLFITGLSMLIESGLMRRQKNRQVIEAVLDVLLEVEGLVKAGERVENGLQLLRSAKETLQKLAGKKATPNKPEPPHSEAATRKAA